MYSEALGREIRSVAIVMLSAIGDAVHVLPVANALKRADPGLHITWIIQPVPHRLVHNHPAIDDFVLFKRRSGLRLWGEYRQVLSQLRARRFDLMLGLQVYLKAGLLLGGARAGVKLGFDRRRARDLNWLFSTHRIPAREPQHVQEQYFEFVRWLGVDPNPVRWGLVITPEERRAQAAYFDQVTRPVCAFVVGTSKLEKNWPAERYAQLIDIAHTDLGYEPMLVGGPSEVERAAARAIESSAHVPIRNELGNDLRRLLYLIDGSDVVVSPDTGPLHIARALEVPVVGLYGYTNPRRTGPYGRFTDLVVDGYARYPGEEYGVLMTYRKEGMGRVTVSMAAEKLDVARRHYARTSPRPGSSLGGER